jgi:hypothetical protein
LGRALRPTRGRPAKVKDNKKEKKRQIKLNLNLVLFWEKNYTKESPIWAFD